MRQPAAPLGRAEAELRHPARGPDDRWGAPGQRGGEGPDRPPFLKSDTSSLAHGTTLLRYDGRATRCLRAAETMAAVGRVWWGREEVTVGREDARARLSEAEFERRIGRAGQVPLLWWCNCTGLNGGRD